MTKKSASLAGKGPSILLGEEKPSEESLPIPLSELEGDLESNEDGNAAEQEPEEEIDWDAMLKDEASTAEPPEEEKAGAPAVPTIEHYYEPDSTAEAEPLPSEKAAIEGPAPAPSDSVAPAMPVATELETDLPLEAGEGAPPEEDWAAMMEDEASTAKSPEETTPPPIEHHYPVEEPAISTTPPASPAASQPPPEKPTSLPTVRIGGLLAGTSLIGEGLPSPGPSVEKIKIRESDRPEAEELSEEEEEIVIKRVTRKQRRELFEHISQLYRKVPKELSSSGQQAQRDEALLLLSEARDIVIETPRQYDQAEHKVAQAEAIIANAANIEKWSQYYGNRLIAYLVSWFLVLMAGIVFISPISAWIEGLTSGAGTASKAPPVIVAPLLFTMMWGGIGGIVGGIHSLWRHITVFDKQYTIWYTLQPIAGLVLGGIVHVVVMTGFLSMSIQATGAGATTQESQAVQWFPALLAVVFGFRQNDFYALLKRIIGLVGQRQEDEQESEEGA
ncbi:MAG: hypothetical protein B6I34_02070 [Anaerolineaceae bacterium 4572_32.1]|nr:MAG: hypothetical protein B6I34_02070 [Anaerolineaceae bacterium 4572_32.1]